ncbi:unnamed protein product [Didymodactylos carnosus]|uniref:Adiponectin receptor protein 1 n=1 Tax=Didymodactylos carnosus TaxID=1234261 RepID=A0A814RDY0_9BILA|nr:unnamed protein product [Didymodactylos carnosus]CAF3894771.1 unnamed protein product [Didymodactylos carnosus]
MSVKCHVSEDHHKYRSASAGIVNLQSTCSRRQPHLSYGDLCDKTDELVDSVFEMPTKCVEQAREVGKRVVEYVVDHSHLPHWLVDNEFLISGHRPPMPSVKQCFASIFRLHTETVNIWTHLLVLFITFGLFGFIPTCHYIFRFGLKHAFTTGATQWVFLVAALYATGACLYAGK